MSCASSLTRLNNAQSTRPAPAALPCHRASSKSGSKYSTVCDQRNASTRPQDIPGNLVENTCKGWCACIANPTPNSAFSRAAALFYSPCTCLSLIAVVSTFCPWSLAQSHNSHDPETQPRRLAEQHRSFGFQLLVLHSFITRI